MREQHRHSLFMSAVVAALVSLSSAALVTGCGDKNKADSKGEKGHVHKDGDGHDHKEGDGHDHKEGDGHDHKEGDGHKH